MQEAARDITAQLGLRVPFYMATLKIYTEDLQIARALIKHDERITRNFFYRQCYPLFKSIYDNYYTDCTAVKEFIDEIYIVVLAPSKTTGKCQMENFKGESSLMSWVKSACLYYCYNKFKRKKRIPLIESLPNPNEEKFDDPDRFIDLGGSSELDFGNMNREDVEIILNLMPNSRYSQLIRMRYLDMKSNEETAKSLGVNMDNYYNIHKRAKLQYERVCRKEEYYG